tara:strand:- start:4493 stop:5026 length:534 start_codon:yes stop_codon:yes gene_type:complete
MKLNQVINTINKFAENVKAEAKKNLQKKSSTGSLKESINYKLTDTEKGFILSFFGTEYADFIDKGVKGAINDKSGAIKNQQGKFYAYTNKMPPPNKLDKWIVRKGIAPRNRGKFTGRKIDTVGFRKSIQFLIARSIYSKGIKASLFFTKPFEKYYKSLAGDIVNKFLIDIENKIDKK